MIGSRAAVAPVAAPAPAAAVRWTPTGVLARGLLLAAMPFALWWVPLGVVPAAGNVTASDLVLGVLWALTAWRLLTGGAGRAEVGPVAVVLLAATVGVLAGLAAELTGSGLAGTFEVALFMKRFGLAAILPLAAVVFRTPGMAAWTRAVAFLTLAAQVLFTLVPSLQERLTRPDLWDPSSFGDRATGLVTNPNELAYTSVALGVIVAALTPRRPRVLDRAVLLAALAGAGVCLVQSASRSGLLGAGAAVLVAVSSGPLSFRARAATVAVVVAVVGTGLASTSIFEERVTRAYAEGTSEENVASRLDMQAIALRASLEHPLGVGYTGFEGAGAQVSTRYQLRGSDSFYVDTLLGAGFPGLLAALLLMAAAFRQAGRTAPDERRGARVLQAGIAAFAVFGTAAVAPISISSAPLFFSIAAASAYLRGRSAEA